MKIIPDDSLAAVVFEDGGQLYTVRRYDEDGNMYHDARFYYKVWRGGREIDKADAPRVLTGMARDELAARWAKFCKDNPDGRYQLNKSW